MLSESTKRLLGYDIQHPPYQNVYTEQSSGCSRWLVCGGKVTMTIRFFLEKSVPGVDAWLLWLSSGISTGLQETNATKCCKNSDKVSAVIHPDGQAVPALPVGASFSIRSRKYTVTGTCDVVSHTAAPASLTSSQTVAFVTYKSSSCSRLLCIFRQWYCLSCSVLCNNNCSMVWN